MVLKLPQIDSQRTYKKTLKYCRKIPKMLYNKSKKISENDLKIKIFLTEWSVLPLVMIEINSID